MILSIMGVSPPSRHFWRKTGGKLELLVPVNLLGRNFHKKKPHQQHEIWGKSRTGKGETNSAHEGGKLRPCLLGMIKCLEY